MAKTLHPITCGSLAIGVMIESQSTGGDVLEVRILGGLEVTRGGSAVDLGIRQARALFSLLALRARTPVRGASLAEALWPQGPPPRWEATVQSHVSRLRKSLEPDRPPRAPSTVLRTTGNAYVLDMTEEAIDAGRFEKRATEGRSARAAGELRRAKDLFESALVQWRGEPLADFPHPDAIAGEVARLQDLQALTREDWAETTIALGEHRSAVGDLESLVIENPFRERAWELLLLALYRSGRQSDAVRRYREVRALLGEALGIEPGPALRALELDILRHEPALSPRPDATAEVVVPPVDLALPVWLRSTRDLFVGRSAERRWLQTALQQCGQDERLLALVTGEPGIGKSRLLREVAGTLWDEGALVVGGRCVEAPLHVLEPFAEAVERLAVLHADRLERDAPGDLAALAGLVPELSGRLGPNASFDADAHRYLLFRAVSSLLDSRRLGRPTVLVLEDLHWAAPVILQLLSHLVRDVERGPLLVLATARDTEPNNSLAATLVDLQREHRCGQVHLVGLSETEVEQLAEARGGSVDGARLYELTEGNPFYVEELVRHVAARGDLGAADLPESVRDAIAHRLLRLPEATRRLLGVAAVSGRAFRLDVVARAAEFDLERAEDALGAATSTGVVSEQTRAPGVYTFTHALIPGVLRDGLGPSRPARVHRRFGEALAELGGSHGEVARHLLAGTRDGSDVVAGAEAALVAARVAVQQYTYDDAVAILAAAWSALESRPDASAELACSVAIALAIAHRRSGAYEERIALLEQAWARASASGSEELRADVIVEGCSGTVNPTAPWPSRAEEVVARLGESSDRRVMLTAILCHVASREPGDDAKQLAEWGMTRIACVAPADRRVVTQFCIPVIAASSPVERVVDLARGSLVDARRSGDEFDVIETLSVLRRVQLAAADVVASEETAREYEELVSSVRIPRFMAGVEQRRAMMALLQGRFGEAEAHASEAVALQPVPEFLEGFAVQLFALRFEQGRLEEVREAVEDWAEKDARAAWTIGVAVLHAMLGELDAARRTLAPLATTKFDSVPRDDLYFLSLAVAAWTVVLLEDRKAAEVLYELLSPHASRVIVAVEGAVCWGSVHRFLGPLAVLIGTHDRAAMHFETSISIDERLGALPFLARDRLAYAELLRRQNGDPVRIEDLHRTGLSLAARLGMQAVVERYDTDWSR
jgi:DNA-binding SARP family transcriptional activator